MKLTHYFFLLLIFASLSCDQPTEPTKYESPPPALTAAEQKKAEQDIIMKYTIDNGSRMSVTKSGIHFEITNGAKQTNAALGSAEKVIAHYHGTFLDGKVFDSSVDRGRPFSFEVGSVIPGWREAIRMMEVGDKGTFIIPSHLAYGRNGYPGLIEPNTILKFEIELLGIKDQ